MRYHEVIQANFQRAKRYWAVISAPKFKNSEIYVVTLILKKSVFIPSQVYSGRISSAIGHFSAYRNQRLSSPPTMWGGEGLGMQFDQFLCPGTWPLPCTSCTEILYQPLVYAEVQAAETMEMNEASLNMMRKIYINSNLETLTKFSCNFRSTAFKYIIPSKILKMITKTILIHTGIVIS